MSRCTECRMPMILIDGATFHPNCDPHDPIAALIRAEHAAWKAGVEGQNQAAEASPDDFALALSIVQRAAKQLRVFSANQLNDPASAGYDARWCKLGDKIPGSAMGAASRRRWCRKTGHTVPAISAKGHHIPEWESLIYVELVSA